MPSTPQNIQFSETLPEQDEETFGIVPNDPNGTIQWRTQASQSRATPLIPIPGSGTSTQLTQPPVAASGPIAQAYTIATPGRPRQTQVYRQHSPEYNQKHPRQPPLEGTGDAAARLYNDPSISRTLAGDFRAEERRKAELARRRNE